ncbi:MAG: pyridoxal 5'-phosphate synthase glutaminase subunit PdxT [Clostridia bacterium]|nr:pyridoxal 5'-phosphate synthase glutaminase subunit PdxT [Clostridia bacterium]
MKIGVLALQGAFREHRVALEKCGCEVVEVRKAEHLDGLAGLVLPGGESTTIGKLLNDFILLEPIRTLGLQGMPIFATCAGLIVLAKDIEGSQQPRLGLLDAQVRRNAFGRQVDSFEIDLPVAKFSGKTIRSVFIRAPYILKIYEGVEILASHEDKIVMVEQGNLLATAFHPELTDDLTLHQYFVSKCSEYVSSAR